MNVSVALDPLAELQTLSDVHGWGGTLEYTGNFDQPILRDVLSLWNERARGHIPFRSDLDARGLLRVLPHLWMIEAVDEPNGTRYRSRRMGTVVASVFGDWTGRYLDEILPGHLQKRWMVACECFLRCRRPVRFTCTVDLPQASYLSVEAFHAPLLDGSGNPTILMGVSYFKPAC